MVYTLMNTRNTTPKEKTLNFTVTFLSRETGLQVVSRIFGRTQIRSARKHAEWLRSQSWASDVALWRGAAGGERLA
jgi:hypothetical protein